LRRCNHILILLIIITNVHAQDAIDVLRKSSESIKNLHYFSYKAIYEYKPTNTNDTSKISTKCYFLKDTSEHFSGAKIRIIKSEDYELLYDGQLNYSIDHKKKEIYIDDPKITKRKLAEGNALNNVIMEPLLATEPFEFTINNKDSIEILKSDSVLHGQAYFFIDMIYHNIGGFTKYRINILFDTNNYLPYSFTSWIFTNDGIQYKSLFLNDFTQSNETPDMFSIDTLDLGYKIIYYKPVKHSNNDLLPLDSKPPDFVLKGLDEKEIQLSRLKGKIVIVDFWYMNCPPCIKAIPHLESIYQAYKDKGLVVLGINSIDTDSSKIENLKNFLKKRQITYPILFADKEFTKKYKVEVYPVLYILNKKGFIIYHEMGFGDLNPMEWEKVIIDNLK